MCLTLFVILLHATALGQRHTSLRVPQEFASIQSAVDAARVNDTVLVDHGLYFENLRINKNIVLASRFILDGDTAHISQTVLDGSRPGDKRKASTVYISGPTDTACVVVGFTIQGGSGSYVFFFRAIPGTQHQIIGGGVLVLHAGARIAYNVVTRNVLSGQPWARVVHAGGIAATDTSGGQRNPPRTIIERNTVSNNTLRGERGGACGIGFWQPGEVRHNIVTGNSIVTQGRSGGGGIELGAEADYDVVLDGNYISRNSASIGAGLLITSGLVRRGRLIVENNIIAHNEAFEVGGGVNVAEECYAVFVNNTIVHNRALSYGGGINITLGAHATLVNNILWQNEVDQLSVWGHVQTAHNLIQGGPKGRGTIHEDPAFLPEDSLFRLSQNSPCLGAGLPALRLADRPFPLPPEDLADAPRSLPPGSAPDIGAVESPFVPSSTRILREQTADSQATLRLTIIFRQTSPPERRPGTEQVIRAGRMATTVVVNDVSRHEFEESFPGLSFTLPPGRNFLEIEILGPAKNRVKGSGVFYQLEGFESRVLVVTSALGYMYQPYTDLKPGSYRLMLQPIDDETNIGHTNKIFIDILVLPFWYQQWWAYAIYAAVVVTVAYTIFRVRARRLRLELETTRLSELDRMKSRFLANVSHEFRTPLSLILGPTDQLVESEAQPERKEQLGIVKRNAERLLRMVNQLLQFSRLEAGTLKLHVRLQSVPPIIRRIVSLFSTAAVKKDIGLHVEIEPAAFQGYIDVEKMEHILENLVSNAIKYTPAGGQVSVRAHRAGSDLVLDVTDSGQGISPDALPHVFERFYRADASHQYEGTGIGLSLTKELVEMHHGTIAITSTLGVGTVATVRLPLSGYQTYEIVDGPLQETGEQPASQEPGPSPVVAHDVPTAESTVVLVVEDNEDARRYIRSRLWPEFNVVEAVNGAQALDYAVSHLPDVIVTDVMMPELSGYELCVKLKQDERTSHIPVILLTALADQADRIEGLQTGADDYLVKPFDARELVVRVRNLIATRKRLQERFRTSVPLKPGEISVTSLDDKFLQKAMSIVEAHLSDEHFGIEQFAHEAHMSRAQLHRKLTALTGLPPTDFVRYIRLQRARDLLEKKAGTVSEVAYIVGFSHLPYFSKCFKGQFGFLPSEAGQPGSLSGRG